MTCRLTTIILVLVSMAFTGHAAPSVEAVLLQLDSCLENSAQYDRAKEKRIDRMRQDYNRAPSPAVKYDKCITLFEEYGSYKYDSAYAYADRASQLAQLLDDDNRKVEASCAMVFCQSSAGFYKEAFDTFGRIVMPLDAAPRYKARYYETAARLHYDISDYNFSRDYHYGYIDKGDVYTDSLLQYLPQDSKEWLMATARRQMLQGKNDDGLATFNQLLARKDVDEHSRAIALSSVSWILRQQGKEDEGLIAAAQAAMCDLRSSTNETTALCNLAELLYNRHDVQRATRYIRVALDDGSFYGARQRLVQVGNILPIIENERNEILLRQRSWLIAFFAFAVIAAAAIGLLAWQAVKKSRKLKEANGEIAQRNELLEQANQALAQTNLKLKEADKIKSEYIGTSFYSNSVYMDKLEKIATALNQKILARKYDDLREMLGGALLKSERSDLFANFDRTFLNIFPTFIEEYSQLFAPEDRPHVASGEPLTSEMRIFALIRLGITDSDRIAKFLGKSVNTINTYKSRVKNRSLLPNEDFEPHIMLIGTTR